VLVFEFKGSDGGIELLCFLGYLPESIGLSLVALGRVVMKQH
jgi:hypothetical protein